MKEIAVPRYFEVEQPSDVKARPPLFAHLDDDRLFGYFPAFLTPRRLAEMRTPVVQEAYIQGISTSSVDDLIRAMSMKGSSKSQACPGRGRG